MGQPDVNAEFSNDYGDMIKAVEHGHGIYSNLQKQFDDKYEGVVHVPLINKVRDDFKGLIGGYEEALTLLGTVDDDSSNDFVDIFLEEVKATQSRIEESLMHLLLNLEALRNI